MGGTNSVIAKSFSLDNLTDEQKQKYREYQSECTENGLNEEETNIFMMARYKEAFGEKEEEMTTQLSEELPEEAAVEIDSRIFDFHTNEEGHISLKLLNDAVDEEDRELFLNIQNEYDSIPVDLVNSNDSYDDAYEEALIAKLYDDRHHNPDEDVSKILCPICRLEFETLQQLVHHKNHSEVHLTALKRRKNSYNDGRKLGKRLSLIAMEAILKLNELMMYTTTAQNVPRLKSAVHRAMAKKITQQYEATTQKMFFSPKDVKLMHSETKLFALGGGHSVTYDIRLYLHYDLHCIEVVPHLLKNAPDPHSILNAVPEDGDVTAVSAAVTSALGDSFSLTAQGKALRHMSFGYQMSIVDQGLLTSASLDHDIEVVPLPRIYLNYNGVLDVVMGLNSMHNSLETVSQAEEIPKRAGNLSPRSQAKFTHEGRRTIGGVEGMTIDDSIVAFLQSHLKSKCQGAFKNRGREEKHSEYDLVFTGLASNQGVLISCPHNLIAQAPPSQKAMLMQWENSWINL